MAQSHKSPYEIRQHLLQLAFDILKEQHHAKAGASALENNVELHCITSAPTTDEVIAEAKKLNDFVSARGDRQ
jgi:hypothetical protein